MVGQRGQQQCAGQGQCDIHRQWQGEAGDHAEAPERGARGGRDRDRVRAT